MALAGGLAVTAAGLLWGPRAYDGWMRARHGVAPGVTVAGEPAGRLLPQEAEALLVRLADRLAVAARDAALDPATGRVIPEVVGRVVDVPATLERLMAAGPGEAAEPVYTPVLPRVTAAHFQPVFQGSGERAQVAIGINVDWGEEHIPALLEILRDRGVRVSWFVTGRWASKNPELLRRLAREGHEIGNHGTSHEHPKDLADPALRELIEGNRRLLTETLGELAHRVVPLFAPPYGEFDARVVAVAASTGHRTVLWTLDTIDWQNPPPSRILERILPRARNGAIVLAHPTAPTVQALPALIDGLRRQGFEVVPVGEILAPEAEVAPSLAGASPLTAAGEGAL